MSSPSCSSASSGTSAGAGPPSARGVLPAVFCLSAAALANEIVLIRLLSFRFWPHFVPLIVSQAMLGLGAAGVALHLGRDRVARRPGPWFARAVLLAAPAFDLAFRASARVPFDPYLLLWDLRAWPPFALFFVLLAVPFFLAGAATAIPFAFLPARAGRVYAAAFAGSAAGTFLALPFVDLVPTEHLMRLPTALGAAGGAFVVRGAAARGSTARALLLGAALLLLLAPAPDAPLSPYKDLSAARRLPGAREIAARSGLSGDYRALYAPGIHSAPGLGLRFTGEIPPQAALFADGEGIGIVPRDGGKRPPDYLDYLPAVLPYGLADRPRVLQIGLRGTEGVLAAARGGASAVTVVEPSREAARLVERDLAGFSAGWPGSVEVTVRVEAARVFLARDRRLYDVVELPDLSSAGSSAPGIRAAGENHLLTREGVRAAMARAGPSGLLAFSGWIKAPPRESVKMLRTVRAELERSGAAPASARVVMIRGWGSFSAVVRRTPFGASEIDRVRRLCEERGFTAVWPPDGSPEAGGPEGRALRAAVESALEGPPVPGGAGMFDLEPTTDDSPYFHRLLRLGGIPEFRRVVGRHWVPFVEWGIVFVLLSLAVSTLVAAVCLLPPALLSRRRGRSGDAAAAAYFSALGLGYILVEMTFLKAGVLILGDQIRAAGMAIGGFALFSGLGSAASERLGSDGAARGLFGGIAGLAAAGFLALSSASGALLPQAAPVRAAAFVGALAPAAFLMGVPFPAAVSRLAARAPGTIPLAWALNGFFSVAGASLASVGALWIGLRGTAFVGAALYLGAGFLFGRVGRPGEYRFAKADPPRI